MAAQPMLIEFFGTSYKCSADRTAERQVEELLKAYPNASFLNCRLENAPTIPHKEAFARSFCNSARIGYFQEMRLFGMATPMIVVNGRYEAYNNEIEAAIKVALSLDQIKPIEVMLAEGGLNISVPAAEGVKGQLYLYTYANFEKEALALEDGTVVVESKDGASVSDGVFMNSKPFRPVVRREEVAYWDGSALQLTYPLKADAFPDYEGASLGYVAVIHEGGLSSPVVAVGELPAAPVYSSESGETPGLPYTEPVLPFKVVPEAPPAPPR